MKLAVLGGTFDPIHKSHISLIEYVKNTFDYDKILLIPAGNPPLKQHSTEVFHRMEMVRLVADDLPWVEVCDFEVKKSGKSYTVLTMEELYRRYDLSEKISIVAGTEAYIDLPKWYQSDKLKELANFILFERGISYDDERVSQVEKAGFEYIKAKMPFKDVSSTEIRRRVKNNEDISQFVTKEVEDYIKEHGLYR